MKNDSSLSFFIFIAIIALFGIGYVIGYDLGEQFAQKETIVYCVEKPADCKIKYDFYKLEDKK